MNPRIWIVPALALAASRAVHTEVLTYPATGHALGCTPGDAEKANILDCFQQLNGYRLVNGLNALKYDVALQQAVEGHCHHMPQHQFFSHFGPDTTNEPESTDPSTRAQANGVTSTAYAENIGFGYPTAADVMNAWKSSQGHNQNMLDPTMTAAGVGCYIDSVGLYPAFGPGNYWGQLFDQGPVVTPPETTSPTVATSPSANPNPVSASSAALSVLGADALGEPTLIYYWGTMGTPPAVVSFSPNGTNAAKNTTATFAAAGSYTLVVLIVNSAGLQTSATLSLTVNQVQTSATVSPTGATVAPGATFQFTATARDQFGNPMSTQPSFNWSVAPAAGSISSTGLFTAGSAPGGPFMVTATSGGQSATTSVTVSSTAPVLTSIVVSPPTASVATSGLQQFTATALDQFTNPLVSQPTFTWTATGGTVTQTGLYTAGMTAGRYSVRAASGAVAGSATVAVGGASLAYSGSNGCGATGVEILALLLLLRLVRGRGRAFTVSGRGASPRSTP